MHILNCPEKFTSLKLVTSNTVVGTDEVPRPPVVYAPIPSAPGKAICCACKDDKCVRKNKEQTAIATVLRQAFFIYFILVILNWGIVIPV